MERSFSISLVGALIALSSFSEADAVPTYYTHAWASITSITVTSENATPGISSLPRADAWAHDAQDQDVASGSGGCTCVPAPMAIALGAIGIVAVVYLRRRRVI